MLTYFTRRIGIALITLLLITFVIYGLIRNMPGNPLTQEMSRLDPGRVMSAEDFERLNKIYGLDKPWYVAYGDWLANLAQFDLGRSFSRKRPVVDLIVERMWPTLMLSVTSLFLAYLLAVPLGLYASARAGRTDERVMSTLLYMLYSFPSFVAALFLQLYFAVKLGWLPLFGMVSDGYEQMSTWEKTIDLASHALMPVMCYTYGSLAYYSRFIRANMHEVLRQDYIRTARAKGLGPVRVLVQHAFRNTLIPFVTLLGLTLPGLLSGSIIIEQIFTWPGMGRLFFESIRERDYPTIMGLTFMFAVLTLAGQLVADTLYAVVDPRVRLEEK